MATVHYRDFAERSVDAGADPRSLLDVSLGAGLPHFHQCNGRARCTTCRVRVLEGMENLSSRLGEELQIATERGWPGDIRLACQAQVLGDVAIERLVRDEGAAEAVFPASGPLRRGEEKHVAVMFCDMRNFTRLAATHLPHDVIHILNRFLQAVCEPVLANRGYLDKYLGDGFLAVFGLDDAESCCLDAVRAATRMPELVEELNRSLAGAFDVRLEFGIALHFGEVVVGDVGHPLKTQFTVLGDTVNIASRIEGLNKRFGTRLLVSSRFHEQVASFVRTGIARRVKIANRWEMVREVIELSESDGVSLVRRSFERVRGDAHRFGELFYEALFREDPAIVPLFARTDMAQMREMLIGMLDTAVRQLADLSLLGSVLRELGVRHAGYGVRGVHFPAARRALEVSVEDFFGEEASPELVTAWTAMFDKVTAAMIEDMPPE